MYTLQISEHGVVLTYAEFGSSSVLIVVTVTVTVVFILLSAVGDIMSPIHTSL